jgi:hypothetical protein
MVVMAERTTWFRGTVVTAGQRGPNGGDGRMDDAVLECDSGGGQGGGGMVSTMEEEHDGAVHEHNNEAWAEGVVPKRDSEA